MAAASRLTAGLNLNSELIAETLFQESSSTGPTFSIVIPTRNRAHLLRRALSSALGQHLKDLEVIVSDNFSTPETAEVAREPQSDRIRYVRSSRALTMPESWEFALHHARGEWVTFLCDDDALAPDCLATVREVVVTRNVELVVWARAGYFHDTWPRPDHRNIGTAPAVGGKFLDLATADTLRLLFALPEDGPLFRVPPLMLNCAVHRRLIEHVRTNYGHAFGAPCPDYAVAAELLTSTPRYVYIDRCLAVNGSAGESIGAATLVTRGEAHDRFLAEFGDDRLLRHVPLSAGVVTNYIADTLLTVREQRRDLFGGIEIGWNGYFRRCYAELQILQANGVDVSAELWDLRMKIRDFPFSCRVGLTSSRLRKALRRAIDRRPALAALEGALRGRRRASKRADRRFENIVAYASYLSEGRFTGRP